MSATKVTFEIEQSNVIEHYLRKLLGSNVSELDINELCKKAVMFAVGEGASIEGQEIDGAAQKSGKSPFVTNSA